MAAVPDFFNIAQQQADASNQAAWQTTSTSRPNQNSYFGGSSWSYGPDGRWTQTTSLNPLYQSQNDNLAQLGANRATEAQWILDNVGAINTDGLAAMPENSQGAVQQVIDAMRGLQSPQLQQARDKENARLAAMGITLGSNAYNDTQRNLANQESDADLKAILAGTQEFGNVFNRQMQLRNQGLDERIKTNASNMATFGGLTSGLSYFKPELQSFSAGAPTVAPNIYGAATDAWNAATGNMNAMNAAQAGNRQGNLGLLGSVVSGLGGVGGIASGLGSLWNGISGFFGGGSDPIGDLYSSNNGWADVDVGGWGDDALGQFGADNGWW